jgi:hypothetical protein
MHSKRCRAWDRGQCAQVDNGTICILPRPCREHVSDTVSGQKIHEHDYREGYIRWCAICGDADDDHDGADHPFVQTPREPISCIGCGGTADPDHHFGVYINRVEYVVYCSRKCAWKHDDTKFAIDIR